MVPTDRSSSWRACSRAVASCSPATNRRAIGGIMVANIAGGLISFRVERPEPPRLRVLTASYQVAMDIVAVLVTAFWAMLPAYVPNNAAVLTGGGPPIDGGRTWNGERILGDGKTWRGTGGGIAAGAILALLLNAVHPTLQELLAVQLPAPFPPAVVLALLTGALLGDITASFLKRRTGRERGAAFPGLDQLDFVVGALALTALAAWTWFGDVFTPAVLLAVLILTPALHVGTNVIAYQLGFKDEPW